jgi:hypothetical protein
MSTPLPDTKLDDFEEVLERIVRLLSPLFWMAFFVSAIMYVVLMALDFARAGAAVSFVDVRGVGQFSLAFFVLHVLLGGHLVDASTHMVLRRVGAVLFVLAISVGIGVGGREYFPGVASLIALICFVIGVLLLRSRPSAA